MTNISPTTVAASKEASPLRPATQAATAADDDAADAERVGGGRETAAANNGYLQQGRQYQTAFLPEVRVIAAVADERPSSKSKFRVRDVSPMQEAARHQTGFSSRSTCYRMLVPETTAEKLVLFACLAVFVTLFASLVYFFVKIECVFGTKDQNCISEYLR